MTPKPPPPPPVPAAVPPAYLIISSESPEEFEARVQQAVAAGMKAEPNTMQLSSVAGVVILSQAFVRDPEFEKRVRSRAGNQAIIDIGGSV
jgi:hypothetical protein